MKALVLERPGGVADLAIAELPRPQLKDPRDVLIRVRTAALNHLDLFVLGGLPGIEYQFPHVMVADGAGEIAELGPAVSEFEVGDEVMVNPGISCYACSLCLEGEHSLCHSYGLLGEHHPGTAAEYVVVPAHNLAPKPAAMPWDQAAAFSLVTLTAWRMLMNRGRLAAGETVLIWGIGGGVSQAACQVAALAGATAIIVTSSSDEKLQRAGDLGATHMINHSREDVAKAVRAITGRKGVDLVVDNVGEATWGTSLRVLGPRGRLVTCGGTSGPKVTTDVRKLFWYQYDILGSTMGNHQEYHQISQLAAEGRLWPVVDSVHPLSRGADAFGVLERGDQFGKVVISVTG